MIKKIFLIIILSLFSISVFAQDDPLKIIESGEVAQNQNVTMSFFIVEKMESRGDINRNTISQESNSPDDTLQNFSIILPQNANSRELSSIIGVLNIGDDVWTFMNESIINISSGRLVVNTKVYVKDGQSGDTKLVSKEPYDTVKVIGNTEQRVTEFIDVGVSITAKPTVIDNKNVQVDMKVSVSEVLREPETNRNTTVPVISTRDVNTVVDLGVNQLNILSELTVDKKIETESGIPYLRNIPLLGKLLFKSKKETTARTKLYIVGGINAGDKKRMRAFNELRKENSEIINQENLR